MSEMTATAVLMMLPRRARTPVAVLTDGPVPSSLRLDVFGARELFVRMRRGPGAHGVVEPYREQPRDDLPVESDPAVVVDPGRFEQARFACSATKSFPRPRSQTPSTARSANRLRGSTSTSAGPGAPRRSSTVW